MMATFGFLLIGIACVLVVLEWLSVPKCPKCHRRAAAELHPWLDGTKPKALRVWHCLGCGKDWKPIKSKVTP